MDRIQAERQPGKAEPPRGRVLLPRPTPYGAPAAAEGMGGIVAPLLAGFSVTLIGLVVQGGSALRWPDLALLLLAVAGVLLLAVVQFTFHARQYAVTPSAVKDWWPDFQDDKERQQKVYDDLYTYRACHAFWVRRARRAYNAAICFLLLGLAVVLVPRPQPGEPSISAPRAAAIGTVLLGLAFELAMTSAGWLLNSRRAAALCRRLPPRLLQLAWWLSSGNPAIRPGRPTTPPATN